ncbi:hypothetical protein V6N13_044789 [Hibiscus sabdariffa]
MSVHGHYQGMPRRFVRKYGNQLPTTVKLEVPSGAKWQVELTKSDNMVWMQKGWREFAEHYSLEFGSFVVFRYEGNDHFHVLIFDRTASEIEYPYTSTDEVSRKRKSDLSSPLPQKKIRTGSPYKTGTDSKLENLSSHICLDDPNSGKRKLRSLKKNDNVQGSTGNVDGVGVISTRQRVKMEVLTCSQVLTDTEKARAIQIASSFESAENPAFMVVMRPSSVCYGYRMVVPSNFVMRFLTRHTCNLTLCNSAGKTWSVKYRHAENKRLPALLYGGWRAFVEDNRLKVGDICVFELIKHPEIFLKVFINPVIKNASKACKSQEHDNGGVSGAWGCLKPDIMDKMQPMTSTGKQKAADIASRSSLRLVNRESKEKSNFPCPPQKTLRTDSLNQHRQNSKFEVLSTGTGPDEFKCRNNPGNLRKVEISPGQLNAQGSVKTEAFSCAQPLTAIRRAHAVQIASAFTENPVFVVVMQPSYVCNAHKMYIPSDFARKFLKVHKCNIILCNSAGKTWPVKYHCNPGYKDPKAYILGGWQAFVADNHLGVGDICIFELIKHPEVLMKVVIYPFAKNTSKALKPLAHGSIASRVKSRSLVSDTEPNCQRSSCPSSSREFKYPTDAYIEILDDSPLNQKTRKKLTSPCSHPGTMTRTNRSGSIQAKGIKPEKQKKREVKYSAKDDRMMSGGQRYLKPDLTGKINMEPMTPTEKQRACIGASDFRSSEPSFGVLMHPSCVNSCTDLYIPEDFATRYLNNNGEIILRVPDGRTWTVEYERIKTTNEHGRAATCRRAAFRGRSWRPFVIGNELKVEDVCIFELIKDNENILEVVIHRASHKFSFIEIS